MSNGPTRPPMKAAKPARPLKGPNKRNETSGSRLNYPNRAAQSLPLLLFDPIDGNEGFGKADG